MTVRPKHLTIVGAVGAVALTVGGLTSPALAAGKTMTFGCDLPLGPTSATLTPKIPAKMFAGQALKGKMKVVVHLTPTQTGTAATIGTKVAGTVKAKGEKKSIAYKVSFPATTINAGSAQDITATGKSTITAPKPGNYALNAGAITADLVVSGGAAGDTPIAQSCTAPTGASKSLGTIKVVKDTSKGKVKGKASGKTATVTDTVKAKHGGKVTGKVSFSLKKGSKTVKASGKLSKKGVAKISKKLTAGKWSVTATYKGDKNVKGSKAKGSVTVK
jgi:hypothetical protein